MRQELEAMGVTVYVASHALSGAERGLSVKLGGFGPVEVAAHALRIIGRGVKVCVEISMMAADAGLVELHESIVAVAGTGRRCRYRCGDPSGSHCGVPGQQGGPHHLYAAPGLIEAKGASRRGAPLLHFGRK